jgi:C1A family cysteine protease
VDAIKDGKDCGELSRLFTYYFERSIEHTLANGDCGAEGHDAFTVAKHGIPAETLWPYDISKFEQKPPACWIPGHPGKRNYTLTKPVHAVPQNIEQIKAVLSNNQTMPIGFTVYQSFEDEASWSKGRMPIPAPGESVLGGHEVLVAGWLKSDPDYALVLNSWGTSWGLNGWFLMPWGYLLNANYCSDFRTIVRPL